MITDERYFAKSFNEQMTWIDEEIEHIIKYKLKDIIRAQGKEAYGRTNYTEGIKRLFDIVKTDPKNKPVWDEVDKAERDLIAFLYDEPGALSEREIYIYWNEYMWKYAEEVKKAK